MAYPPPDEPVLPLGLDKVIALAVSANTRYNRDEVLAVLRHTKSVDMTLRILEECDKRDADILSVMSISGVDREDVERKLNEMLTPFVASMQPTRFVPKDQMDALASQMEEERPTYETQGDPRTREQKDIDDAARRDAEEKKGPTYTDNDPHGTDFPPPT